MEGIDLVAVDEARRECVRANQLPDLLVLLADLRDFKTELDILVREVEDDCAKLMPRKAVSTNQVLAERTGGGLTRRNWDSRAIAQDLVKARTEKYGTFDSPGDVADLLVEAAGVSYWKTTALKQYGLDPDEYCQSERARQTVKVERREAIR